MVEVYPFHSNCPIIRIYRFPVLINKNGDLEISNLDTYNLDLENDMGNVSLVMADTRDQYKVTKDGSMSSVHVSDASQVIGNKNIDIDTDMGNVTIHFKGE